MFLSHSISFAFCTTSINFILNIAQEPGMGPNKLSINSFRSCTHFFVFLVHACLGAQEQEGCRHRGDFRPIRHPQLRHKFGSSTKRLTERTMRDNMMSQTQDNSKMKHQNNEANVMGNVAETNNPNAAAASAIKLQTAIRSFLKRLPKPSSISSSSCPIRTINNNRHAKRLSDITMMDFSESEMMGIVAEDADVPPARQSSYNTRWDRQSVSMNNNSIAVAASAEDKFIVPPVRRESQSIMENDISSLTSYSKTTTENGSSSDHPQQDKNFAALQRVRRSGRQISAETDAAVIADRPIHPPFRRESVVRFLPDHIFEFSSVVDMVFEELPSPGQVQSGGFHRQDSGKTNMAVAEAATADQPVKLPKRRDSVSVSTNEKSSSTASSSSSSSSQRVSIGKNSQRFSSLSMDTPPLGPPSRRP